MVTFALVLSVAIVELGLREPRSIAVDLALPAFAEPLVSSLRAAPLTGIGDARAAAIASGVVFGRTEHVTASDEAAFLASGLWHLLAASGQNIALVAGCCFLLMRALGRSRSAGALLALVAIPSYVLVVGGGASIVRAGIMGELAIVAWLLGRLPDARHVLMVAAAVISWGWPGAHRGLGMQLSFACVAALAVWVVPFTNALRARGVHPWLAGALATTLLCSAATAPLLWLRTGSAPFTGIVSNVVAVPIAACLLVVGLAGSLLGLVAREAGADFVGELALAPAGWLARLLLDLAHRAASLPAAQSTSFLLAVGLPATALAACALPREQRRVRRATRICCVACVALPVAGMAAPSTPLGSFAHGSRAAPVGEGVFRIGVLDVGQGDATLLAGHGGAVLVDTGPPEGRVVDRVRALGVDQVDGIVLTHDSLDHRGGFESAVATLRPRWVAMPRGAPGPWERVRALVPRLVELCAGDTFDIGAVARADVLHPRCDGTIQPRTGDLHNDGAMVLLVNHREIRALLPADAEAPVLVGLGLPRLHLLRIAHHGSSDDALAGLLARTTPDAAAISAGQGNDYGHPHPQVLGDLAAAGVRAFRTDRDGSIAFDSDGRTLRLAR